MFRALIAVGAFAALAACAGVEPAGRNAGRAPAPPAPVEQPAPAATATQPAPEAAPAAPPVAAPDVSAPAPTPPPERRAGDDTVVVPGAVETQVLPPGDPRSNAERMEDIRAWDQCVTHVQAAYERDPMRPQLTSPEEYCRDSLGMTDRLAVPESRRRR